MISLQSTYLFSKSSEIDMSLVNRQQLQSMRRLSTGTVAFEPADQGGGAGVALKYQNTGLMQRAVEPGILNAKSYLEAQASGLRHIASALDRLSVLAVQMQDPSKSQADMDVSMQEFDQLRTEISATRQQQFNGIDLMYVTGAATAQTFTLVLNERGDQTMNVTQTDFGTEPLWDQFLGSPISSPADLADVGSSFYLTPQDVFDEATGLGQSGFSTLVEDVNARLARNGAEQSRLGIALDHLRQRTTDSEAAGGRIYDTDVAAEVTKLARQNILVQAVAASRAQSNVLSEVALRVLGG